MSNKSQESGHQKTIAEQFAGLDMDTLIACPLIAASDAQQLLAKSTSELIKDVNLQQILFR